MCGGEGQKGRGQNVDQNVVRVEGGTEGRGGDGTRGQGTRGQNGGGDSPMAKPTL